MNNYYKINYLNYFVDNAQENVYCCFHENQYKRGLIVQNLGDKSIVEATDFDNKYIIENRGIL